jgi:phosphohistidine phosphatase SixA
MRLILVTHAEGEKTRKDLFSGLTETGRRDVIEAAILFRGRPSNIDIKVGKIVCSPHTRCIETVLLFSHGISGFSAEDADRYPHVPSIDIYKG